MSGFSILNTMLTVYYTIKIVKYKVNFQKISITWRSLSPSTRSGPARTGVLSAAEGSIVGLTRILRELVGCDESHHFNYSCLSPPRNAI